MAQRCDLGTIGGEGRYEIDDSFKQAPLRPNKTCIVCGQLAVYQLVAKHDGVRNEAVNSTYICRYHLEVEPAYSPSDYGIREL